ncbi:uncharacterized protein TNCV_4486431 [Trichonephila clavipes]|nr:uncharacterized protein TNCV_4486431 [Trichonephila clavipes]
MPGKRARRHSSKLSEFERSLIIGIKTAGSSTYCVAGQVDRSQCEVRNCWEQRTREVTLSTIRADVGVASVPQTISRHLAEANLKSKHHFRALPLTPEHRQLRLLWCQARSMWYVTDWQNTVFSDEYRFVLGTDGNRERVRMPPDECKSCSRHCQTLSWPAHSPDLSPVEHVGDQLKWQMPSCHSVHDLELAVQDLWARLPQDNIRCLINSMPDRVAACIEAGGGPTRY